MGKLTSGLGLVALAAAGGAFLLAYRISQESGKGLVESFSEVPAEAERYLEELRARGAEAFQAGREAAREKQSEIDEQMQS
jgi:hypothetical protein